MKDLVILVADVQAKAVLEALLQHRLHSLGLPRELTVDVVNSAGTDGGVRTRGTDVLRYLAPAAKHAMMIFDHHGCGDDSPAEVIEEALEKQLRAAWGSRAACIVLEPELEEWVVGARSAFGEIEELSGVDATAWWSNRGFKRDDRGKPVPVKAAIDDLFDAHGARRSAANYRLIAGRASLRLDRCQSRSFHKLVRQLREWFA